VTDVAIPGGTVGKFQIIEGYPPISPNKCMTCGKYHGTFIDFGFNDDWYGAVYFCTDCISDMATQLGYCGPSQKNALISSNKIHLQKRHELEEELKRYKDAVDALGVVGIHAMHPNSDSNSTMESISNSREEQLTIDFESSGDEQGSVESDDVEGSSGLRDDDSLDQFIDTI
jgi:hypothetical protein